MIKRAIKLDIKKEGKEKKKRGNEKTRERESEKYLHITFNGCYALKY